MKNKKLFIFLMLGTLVMLFTQCKKDRLDVEYLMEPDQSKALANPEDLLNLLSGGYLNLSDQLMSSSWVHNAGFSDNMSVTNAYRGFWGFCEEPRNRINNSTTWADLSEIDFSAGLYKAISAANEILRYTKENKIEIGDDPNNLTDETPKAIAGALFLRGVATGYLGLIYDQGFRVTDETDLSTVNNASLVGYNDMITGAVEDLTACIAQLEGDASNASFDYWPNTPGNQQSTDYWIQLCNSYAALFTAGAARSEAEAASVDWAKVKSFADNGITEDFNPVSDSDFANWYHDWFTYPLSSGAAYLQVDIRIPYLANQFSGDGTYPWEYPEDETVILDAAGTTDPRLSSDFWYTTDFGYLRADRGRYLFSNYGWSRFQYNHPTTYVGNPMHIFMSAVNDLLKAEAEMHISGDASAQAMLLAGTFGTRGGYTSIPAGKTTAEVLEYEYAIEGIGQPGVNWFFMRRNDMLKLGTPLHYPMPANELETLVIDPYSFGGSSFADGIGTSKGQNQWAPLHGASKKVSFSVESFSVSFSNTNKDKSQKDNY